MPFTPTRFGNPELAPQHTSLFEWPVTFRDTVTFIGIAKKEYASFYLSTGGVTAVAAAATTLTLNATAINSNTDVFDLASSIITVDKAGDFKFEAECYFNNSSTSRTEYSMYFEVDTGGGYAEIAGTRAANYERGYDSGDTSAFTTIQSVSSGDKFRLRIIRTDGAATAGYQDNNGTRLTITEM